MLALSENTRNGFIAADAFFLIGCVTWFFSTRRKLFIRVFVPAEELRKTARSILRDSTYVQGMRFIALLQMGIGMIMALVSLAAYLVW
jgi:hypothetical protein